LTTKGKKKNEPSQPNSILMDSIYMERDVIGRRISDIYENNRVPSLASHKE